MATTSQSTQYRDGSLGTLETDASVLIDTALDQVVASLQPAGLESRALPSEALVAASIAVALAQAARAEVDVEQKIVLAIAASYSAAFFGLPRNTLLYTIDQVCGMFAMTAGQRRQYHTEAAKLLQDYVVSLKKGDPMSGVFRDGVLGGAYRDGSLGAQNGAFRDGSLGAVMLQHGAFHDGSLGASGWMRMRPNVTHAGGALMDPFGGKRLHHSWNRNMRGGRKTHAMSGLGGCGCSGVGADAAVATPEVPFYKKPVVLAGAAAALGLVLYAVSRR